MVERILKTPWFVGLDEFRSLMLYQALRLRFARNFILSAMVLTLLIGLVAVKSLSVLVATQKEMLDSRAQSTIEIVRTIIHKDLNVLIDDVSFLADQITQSGYLYSTNPEARASIEKLFISELVTHSYYDQARILDAKGQELIRVNYNEGNPFSVDKTQLQDKSGRYYYNAALNLQPGEFYLSKLDLNIENGVIELPMKPTLRVSLPIWGENQQIVAMVVINYNATQVLQLIQLNLNSVQGDAMLFDNDGHWLLKDNESVNWSFQLGGDRSFKESDSDIWHQIHGFQSNQFDFGEQHYVSDTINLQTANASNLINASALGDIHWKLVIAYQKPTIGWAFFINNSALALFFVGIYPLCALLALTLCIQDIKRKNAELELVNLTHSLEEQVERRTRELIVTQDATIECLADLAETRDNETGGHIRRTRNYIRLLLDELMFDSPYKSQLTPKICKLIVRSAPLHDIGKVGISDSILLKPGKLTDDEFKIMKTHTLLGFQALDNAKRTICTQSTDKINFLSYACDIALCHHEKWDGSGYPKGLKGEEIPLAARLMSLADVYDALVSKRVYKPAFERAEVEDIILNKSVGHFDPVLLNAFAKLKDEFWTIHVKYRD
ncbi:HD domain-containing phosphohydrolase [Vibrio hippocampi]|uniref:HD-GYP domain-containing protein n=1 Tax=Vibrio hippocampi TaxID=654686 RepID=A0ABN8DKX1_9VIBR|nr:HD domain-containing phosphohydrolase [Vibrio hippocampi]CAH0529974.1 hypothetical protein VHP8226_03700 [Vibrio hippocampi]